MTNEMKRLEKEMKLAVLLKDSEYIEEVKKSIALEESIINERKSKRRVNKMVRDMRADRDYRAWGEMIETLQK